MANDVVEILHPGANKSNCTKFLKNVNDRWKGIKKINTPSGVQAVTTLYQRGLYQLNTTNIPVSVKTLCLVRSLREAFPNRKEFSILSQTLNCQDLTPYHDDVTFRTYHCAKDLGVVYAAKHNLNEPVNRLTIHSALVENNLIEKDRSGIAPRYV